MFGKGPSSNPERRAVCHNRCAIENICIKPLKGFDDGKICICSAKKEKDEKKNIQISEINHIHNREDNQQYQNPKHSEHIED